MFLESYFMLIHWISLILKFKLWFIVKDFSRYLEPWIFEEKVWVIHLKLYNAMILTYKWLVYNDIVSIWCRVLPGNSVPSI